MDSKEINSNNSVKIYHMMGVVAVAGKPNFGANNENWINFQLICNTKEQTEAVNQEYNGYQRNLKVWKNEDGNVKCLDVRFSADCVSSLIHSFVRNGMIVVMGNNVFKDKMDMNSEKDIANFVREETLLSELYKPKDLDLGRIM